MTGVQTCALPIYRIAAEMSRNAGLPLARTTGDLLEREQAFHDAWASSCCPEEVRVHNCFEAATAPENRYIVNLLGDVTGKRILDLGSGLSFLPDILEFGDTPKADSGRSRTVRHDFCGFDPDESRIVP